MRMLLSAALAAVAGPALAGGFTPVVVAPAPVAPVVPVVVPVATNDWSGAYVGAQLGFADLAIDDNDDTTDLVLEEDVYDGSLYGVHAGYMMDFGRIVAGAEIDYDMTDISISPEDITQSTQLGVEDSLDVDSVLRAKLRLGFDAGRFLPYVTAGVARANVSTDDETLDAAIEDSYDGKFVGLGASFLLSDRFTVGVEALRHDFEDTPIEGITSDVDTVTLRGSFRF